MKINLVEILKDAPSGTKLYSLVCGEVEFEKISQKDKQFPIVVRSVSGGYRSFYTSDAKFSPDGECCLFPSKENRDWNSVLYERKVFKNECQIVIKEEGPNAIHAHLILRRVFAQLKVSKESGL